MRPLTKETIEMARQGLLDSDWCGFSKRTTVHQLCDLALKGLSASSEKQAHVHRCMSCGESWYCPHPPADCKAGENVFPSLTLRGPNGPTVFHHACPGRK